MVLAGALWYGCFCEALHRPLCRVTGARKLVWHFDFGRRVTGARKLASHFDFGRMVLATPWVWVLLRGVAKTIVPSDLCQEVRVAF